MPKGMIDLNISLRDYFAGQTMIAILNECDINGLLKVNRIDEKAKLAYEVADIMIKERNREPLCQKQQ